MAWRIEEQVVRGEVDNRDKGLVTGRIWFSQVAEPVILSLKGNPWRDLAGHRLSFVNPRPLPPPAGMIHHDQSGFVGDITASRKVKIPDCTPEELSAHIRAKTPFPWHWGNSLYLEWYSERNGRVLIETADFDLNITTEPTWLMTEEDEALQKLANAAALRDFMDRLIEPEE